MTKKKLVMLLMTVLLLSAFTTVLVNASTVPGDYATIQEAINAAVVDEIITVSAGTYVEDLVITTDGLDLVTTEGATIQGVDTLLEASWPIADPNINIEADNVKIHGFTLASPTVPDGSYSTGIVLTGTDIEIYDNVFFSDAPGNGYCIVIQTWQAPGYPGSDISGLHIYDNSFTGTCLFDSIFLNLDVGTGLVTIEDNVFTDAYRAVSIQRPNVDITGNTIESSCLHGVWVDATDVTVNYNDIQSTNWGVKNTDAETVDASLNYWEGNVNTVGLVDFRPTLDQLVEYLPEGPIGATGSTGAKGSTGSSGSKGSTGATGPSGLDGIDGVNGVDGSDGADGVDGADGLPGSIGLTGEQGPQGIPGEVGPKGDTGDTGLQGPSGPVMIAGGIGSIGLILAAMAFFRKP